MLEDTALYAGLLIAPAEAKAFFAFCQIPSFSIKTKQKIQKSQKKPNKSKKPGKF